MIVLPSRSDFRHEAILSGCIVGSWSQTNTFAITSDYYKPLANELDLCLWHNMFIIQSSVVITRSNIVIYYMNGYRNWGWISIRCWIYKRLVNIFEKIDHVLTEPHCIWKLASECASTAAASTIFMFAIEITAITTTAGSCYDMVNDYIYRYFHHGRRCYDNISLFFVIIIIISIIIGVFVVDINIIMILLLISSPVSVSSSLLPLP